VYWPETSVCRTGDAVHVPNQGFGRIIVEPAIRVLKR